MANQVPSLQVLATVANPRILEDPSIPKKTSEHVIQTIAIERFSEQQADGSIKLGLGFRAVRNLEAIDVPVIRHFVINGYDTLDNRFVYAAATGQADLVQKLMKENPNIDDGTLYRSGRAAARKGHAEVLRVLPLSNLLGELLIEAASIGHEEVIRAFPLDIVSNYHLGGAVQWAARNGHTKALRALPLERISDLEFQVSLVMVVRYGHMEALRYLLSLNRFDWALKLAATVASSNGHVEALRYLISLDKLSDFYFGQVVKLAVDNGHAQVLKAIPLDRVYFENLLLSYYFGTEEIKNIIRPVLCRKIAPMATVVASLAIVGIFIARRK